MSQEMIQALPAAAEDAAGDDFHLLDLMVILARYKGLVLGTTIIIGICAVAATLLMKPMYMSTVKILPPQQQQSSGMAMVLGQLGGLAGAAGGLAGLKSSGDLYIGLLESRTMTDRLITRFKLTERYDTTMEGARRALAANSDISTGKKDGMLVIAVSDRDPQVAASMANAYAEELSRLSQTMALTEASQRRLFFEKQLALVKDQLANAEVVMRTTQEKTGLIQPEAQVQAIISNAARLKGTIAAKEVEINAMSTFATASNPEVVRAREELRSLQGQLGKLEKNQAPKDGNFLVPTGNLPEAGVEYVRAMRDVKYYETIFELLAKQFELAKIDEAKNSSLIQVLDAAIPAEQKYKPKRTLIVITAIVAGFILGMLLAFVRHGLVGSRRNPRSRQRWNALSDALRGKATQRGL